MSVEEENIFKKIPQVYELNNMLYSLISSWESKLNMDYIDDKLSKNEGNKEDIVYLNETIRSILRELSTSTTSQLLSGIQRYIKRPYCKELSDNIVSLHTLFDTIQSKCFKDTTKAPLSILLLGIFLSKCIQYNKERIVNPNSTISKIEYISWYYGDYNTIIEYILTKYQSVYWMDDTINWDGYNHEEVVIIPIQDRLDDSSKQSILLRCYIKSISSFVRANDVCGYIIVSNYPPPNFYIENNLIHSKNVHQFLKKDS